MYENVQLHKYHREPDYVIFGPKIDRCQASVVSPPLREICLQTGTLLGVDVNIFRFITGEKSRSKLLKRYNPFGTFSINKSSYTT